MSLEELVLLDIGAVSSTRAKTFGWVSVQKLSKEKEDQTLVNGTIKNLE